MHTKEQLIKTFNNMNLDYYETESDINEKISIQLKNFEQLCLFIQKHNIDTVFYHLEFSSAEALQITGNVINELRIDDEIIGVMQHDFAKYNSAVNCLDFSRPYILSVYCMYQGRTVYIVERDYWFQALGYDNPQKTAISMIEKKLEEIDRKKEEAFLEREELRDQLREKILADPNFHRCTNKELRRSYGQKLYNVGDIHDLFYSPRHGIYDITLGTFIEEVWREYKASL